MRRLRQWLATVIAPCRCVVTFSDGELMRWRDTDASACMKHDDKTTCIGLRSHAH